ncbi:MAG: efflux RND transporter periplasmic adaptor subunit [Fimbriimonadales bacterium]
MGKRTWIVVLVALVGIVAWFTLFRNKEEALDVEYRYSKVERGELVRSISATGQLVALTTVDVKSKAGGKVVQLLVEEGTVVKKGQTIAIIDPSDTEASYRQAEADLTSAEARAAQAKVNYDLQVATSQTSVADAESALAAARARLARTEMETKRQPDLTRSALQSAQASFDSATENQRKALEVTIPQARRDSAVSLRSAKTAADVAKADLERQTDLLAKGYVSQSTVDRARQTYDNAMANYENAQQRAATLEQELRATERAAQFAVDQARASLAQAKANSSQDAIAQRNLEEAKQTVRQAEIALQRAKDNVLTNDARMNDVVASKASTVRSRVTLDNAKVQLDSTTVVAPRDGVVTLKYLEEGTIIPPGTSTFAQGTSLVQISDVTKMYVECAVDEADIGSVQVGQKVRIVTEAYPSEKFEGKVVRVNPAAQTAQNVTAVKVRVEVSQPADSKVRLMPGLNATCEFITLSKPNVVLVPGQAIQRDGAKSTVKIKSKDPQKPEIREVKVGESGNNGTEVLSGLNEGEEVVTAEIDLKAMRETQQKMQEALQGGGLAGGQMGGQRRPTTGGAGGRTGAGGAGGARTGGGGSR